MPLTAAVLDLHTLLPSSSLRSTPELSSALRISGMLTQLAAATAATGTNRCAIGGALDSKTLLSPIAVARALKVAEVYASASCAVVTGDSALRLVKLTKALKLWLNHCQKTTWGTER